MRIAAAQPGAGAATLLHSTLRFRSPSHRNDGVAREGHATRFVRVPPKKKAPHCGAFLLPHNRQAQASAASSLYASTGMQAQNTFLSPWTLSTRATGGQYFCCFSVASGKAASSRG